jgi:hypothetical protein
LLRRDPNFDLRLTSIYDSRAIPSDTRASAARRSIASTSGATSQSANIAVGRSSSWPIEADSSPSRLVGSRIRAPVAELEALEERA